MATAEIAAIPLQPRAAECRVPLTASQLNAWNAPAIRANGWRICVASLRIGGALDVALLGRCIAAVVHRHEALRTTVAEVDGGPVQRINSGAGFHVEIVDLRRVAAEKVDAEARRLANECIRRKSDLCAGPLFEATVLQLADYEHVLIWTADHMVTDSVSYEILTREVWMLYRQAAQGLPFSLPALALQFADYAVWQQQVTPAWLKEHEGYWRTRLPEVQQIQVPIDAGATALDELTGMQVSFLIGRQISDGLRALASQEGIRLPLLVMTVYLVVMARWCERSDLVVRLVTHGRQHPDLKTIVGFLANQLYLRVQVGPNDSFLDVLKSIQQEFQCSQTHRDADRVLHLLPRCRTELYFNWIPSNPTFQWLLTNWAFNWSPEAETGNSVLAALKVEPFPLKSSWTYKFLPLFADTGTDIELFLCYRPDLFSTATVERFARDVRSAAARFVQDPGAASSTW
jgi:hypothetical protein